MKFNDLPTEIIEKILDHYFNDGSTNNCDFHTLSLVSRQWLEIIQKNYGNYFTVYITKKNISSITTYPNSLRKFYNIRIIKLKFGDMKIKTNIIRFLQLPSVNVLSLNLSYNEINANTFFEIISYSKNLRVLKFNANKLVEGKQLRPVDFKIIRNIMSQLKSFSFSGSIQRISNFKLKHYIQIIKYTCNLKRFVQDIRIKVDSISDHTDMLYTLIKNNHKTLIQLCLNGSYINCRKFGKKKSYQCLNMGNLDLNYAHNLYHLNLFYKVAPNITRLSLCFEDFEEIDFSIFEEFKNLTTLRLEHAIITNRNFIVISNCGKLKTLILSDCTDETNDEISENKNIIQFDISQFDIDLDLSNILLHMRNVKFMKIWSNCQHEIRTVIRNHTKLKTLEITHFELSDEDIFDINKNYSINNLVNLEELKLCGRHLTQSTLLNLKLEKLRFLDLAPCKEFSEETFCSIIIHCPNLKILLISNLIDINDLNNYNNKYDKKIFKYVTVENMGECQFFHGDVKKFCYTIESILNKGDLRKDDQRIEGSPKRLKLED